MLTVHPESDIISTKRHARKCSLLLNGSLQWAAGWNGGIKMLASQQEICFDVGVVVMSASLA
jgi:hypothetical protein